MTVGQIRKKLHGVKPSTKIYLNPNGDWLGSLSDVSIECKEDALSRGGGDPEYIETLDDEWIELSN